jgi:pectin methylesterase-like acyl-CoA thioesterase
MKIITRKGIISAYIVFLLTCTGFICFLEFDSQLDECTVSAASADIFVDWNGTGNYTTIQAAIDNATVGDTIYVWDGEYHEKIIINKTLTLIGNGTWYSQYNHHRQRCR